MGIIEAKDGLITRPGVQAPVSIRFRYAVFSAFELWFCQSTKMKAAGCIRCFIACPGSGRAAKDDGAPIDTGLRGFEAAQVFLKFRCESGINAAFGGAVRKRQFIQAIQDEQHVLGRRPTWQAEVWRQYYANIQLIWMGLQCADCMLHDRHCRGPVPHIADIDQQHIDVCLIIPCDASRQHFRKAGFAAPWLSRNKADCFRLFVFQPAANFSVGVHANLGRLPLILRLRPGIPSMNRRINAFQRDLRAILAQIEQRQLRIFHIADQAGVVFSPGLVLDSLRRFDELRLEPSLNVLAQQFTKTRLIFVFVAAVFQISIIFDEFGDTAPALYNVV